MPAKDSLQIVCAEGEGQKVERKRNDNMQSCWIVGSMVRRKRNDKSAPTVLSGRSGPIGFRTSRTPPRRAAWSSFLDAFSDLKGKDSLTR